MRLPALKFPPTSAARLPQVATVLATGVLCWTLARWTWVWLTPLPQVAPEVTQTAAPVALEALVNAHVFGASSQPVATTPQALPLSSLGLHLRGVFAAGEQGAAIIQVQQKDKPFRVGDEVVPGVVLHQVFADYVELSRQGALERLNLERSAAPLNAPPPAPADIPPVTAPHP